MALFPPSRQTNIRGFGFCSVPVTALLVYLFQLVSVIFTYLRADCPCDVTTFLDLTTLKTNDRVGSGRVGSRVKNLFIANILVSERILKIGQYLARVWCLVF